MSDKDSDAPHYRICLEEDTINPEITRRVPIGSTLVGKVVQAAKGCGCSKIILITTNDNLNAMRFYQKRGFVMTHLFRNALDASRKLKPEIPLIGDNGIPLRDEIEFELDLAR